MADAVRRSTSRLPLRDAENLRAVWSKLDELLDDVLRHPGFGEIRIDMRWLKRGQKEVILCCGKQYRFVVSVGDNEMDRADDVKSASAEGTD